MMNRRTLLTTALKGSVGLVALKHVQAAPAVRVTLSELQTDKYSAVYKRLDEFIGRHMDEIGAPGMTVAISNRDGKLRTLQYGLADVKTGTHVGPQTMFEIGSISKSFVAMAIVQLAQEGKLDLNKPVKEYLPWLKIESTYAPITTHHLLSHTSGLSGVPLLMRVASQPLRTGAEPGTQFVYCNLGYDILGF